LLVGKGHPLLHQPAISNMRGSLEQKRSQAIF